MWYQNFANADMLPKKDLKMAGQCMDESEVVTRMMFVLNAFKLYDLKSLDWGKNFDDQGIDSLEMTAVVTSIEHEFHTIFEDHVFDSFDNFDQIKKHLTNDFNAF